MTKKKISNINDELDIELFLYIVGKSLIYAILFIVIAVAVSFFYLRYTYPVYSTSAVIQINYNDEDVSKILGTENFYQKPQSDLIKAKELISSGIFLNRVFAKLPLKVSYFIEGRVLSLEQYKKSPYSVNITVTDLSIYDVPIYIKFISKDKYELSYTKPGAAKFEKEFSILQKVVLPEAELTVNIIDPASVDYSEGIMNQNAYYFVINNPDNIVSTYSAELTVSDLDDAAKTLMISIKDRNPKKATDLVNAIIEEYTTYGVEKKAESANNVLEFIDKQLKIIYDSLFISEKEVDNFKKSNVSDSDYMEPLPSIYSRINDFQNQILTNEMQIDLLSKVEENLKIEDIDIYKLIAFVAGSEFEKGISSFLESLQALLLKKEQLLYEVTKNSGQIESLNYQIEIQKKLLIETIHTLKSNLNARNVKLNKFLDEYQNASLSSKNKYSVLELSRLQRKYNINERFYNNLVEKKAEFQISKASYVSEIVILEKSTIPKNPIYPDKNFVYIIGLIIALFLGIGLIFLRYLFYNEITNVNDIVKYTDAPILGVIPKFNKDIPVSQLIVDKNPKSLIAESLRAVRTNLQFISNEPGPKVIAVTSTISREGKTFFTINLAGIIAFSGKKVIIMDFDLRKPKIHVGFGVENKRGISTILMGLDKVDDCIWHSSVECLDFISAGPIPPNPSELMLNNKMTELLDYLKTKYDYILIDNAPIGIVTDGMRSLLLADYPIYVFKPNYSKRMFVQNVNRLIMESNVKKLSVVLNSVEAQYSSYAYGKGYSYGKSYGYGYGYGYYDKDLQNPVREKFFLKKSSDFIMRKIFGKEKQV
jgi:capsular exopolysaccharide synthesis family protein